MKAIVKVEGTPIISNELVTKWLKFAAVSNKSVETYTGCLRQLFQYFQHNEISKPTRADLEGWRDSLIESGKSASTIQLYLSACRLFFRYLALEGLYPNIADNLKSRVRVSQQHKKDALTAKQANRLLDAAGNIRDKAIMALMLTTGIRSIEVVRANVGDIRYHGGNAYLYVQGKGRCDKTECVLIAPQVLKLLQQYLKARKAAKSKSPLFVSSSRRNQGDRITTQAIRKLVKAYLRQIGIDLPTVTCHSLRHTAATLMFDHQQKLTDIQQVLRHKNVNTTLIYLNTISRFKNRAENIVAQVLRI